MFETPYNILNIKQSLENKNNNDILCINYILQYCIFIYITEKYINIK